MYENSQKELLKSLKVLCLCLNECTNGSALSRNPYLRSPAIKKKLRAFHEAVEAVIQNILIFSADVAKMGNDKSLMKEYYRTYAFLFDFNDGITKEEYDHLILMRDPLLLAKFNKLFVQTKSIVEKMNNMETEKG